MAKKNSGSDSKKPKDSGSWSDKILKKLIENRVPTNLDLSQGEKPSVNNILELNRTQLYKITFDNKSKPLIVAATPETIMEVINYATVTHDILGEQIGYYDFEEWFEDFEWEFRLNLPSTKQLPKDKIKPWGVDPSERPKKLNLLTQEEVFRVGYQKIIFWENRQQENNSEIFTGTYFELRQQLLDKMRSQQVGTEIYGIPTTAYQERFRFLPQILLYFLEDPEDIDPNFGCLDGEISFRLIGETYKTITPQQAEVYANKIATEFGASNGYIWKKGKTTCSYFDPDNGYQLRINVRNKEEGKSLITKVLLLQGLSPRWSKLKVIENEAPSEAYPTIPDKEKIYDKTVFLPRHFPIADVRFQRAELHIWGRRKPVILVDRSYKSKNALVKVP